MTTTPTLRVEADVSFTAVSPDGTAGLTGTVVADGSTINVHVSGPVASGVPSTTVVRRLAHVLAQQSLRLVVHGPQGMLVTLGDVRPPWWQRVLTRSPYVRLGSVRGARQLVRRPGAPRDFSPFSAPPTTMVPLFPTMSTRGPRPVTTTHDPRGGGGPRLIFALSPWPRAGEQQRVEYLTTERTTIGSSAECHIRVAGLEPLHAVVDRTADDEYLLTHVAAAGSSTVAGIPAQSGLLRTGASVALNATRLTYFREEYADHGRPYGGRIGGELGYQRPQPKPRPRAPKAVGKPRTNRDPGRYFH